MTNNGNQKFTFFPRPDAHSMKWGELLPPLRRAVRDLLLRLDGAVKKIDQSIMSPKEFKGGEITANCFLVYGERGTGKTTVLLSVKDAVCKKCDNFFEVSMRAENNEDNALYDDAKTSAMALKDKGIVWLDVLDMETLPMHANPLTTMLTRVRNAICSPGFKNKSPELTSILEEGAESARHKLEQLIKDATLMWEDIHEPDTRTRANRQVAAADIHAHFRDRFQDAMKTLSLELGLRSGRSDMHCPIVLPIDNIDRSTDHLYNIVKLAQMVACPYLWFVMAGDRENVETYLERAYWKELISIGEGAGGAGKQGFMGEDEALLMARRQAAAASHKLLPPSHRIGVQIVEPMDTLFFRPASMGHDEQSGEGRYIYDLLREIDIPNGGAKPKFNLAHLFYAKKFVSTSPGNEDMDRENFDKKYYLTNMAQLGLHLPAREVLDLWQLAHWIVHDHEKLAAEKVVRIMLRNIISESKMSSEMGRRLQEEIISGNPGGETILNFFSPRPEFSITHFRTLDFEYRTEVPLPKIEGYPSNGFHAVLHVYRNEEFCLFALRKRSKHVQPTDYEDLPLRVGAWLAILCDILAWAEKSWVIEPPLTVSGGMHIGVRYPSISSPPDTNIPGRPTQPITCIWPEPSWDSFFALDVFRYRWKEFRSNSIKTDNSMTSGACPPDSLPRLLAAGWVECALDTFLTLQHEEPDHREGTGKSRPRDARKKEKIVESAKPEPSPATRMAITKFEKPEKWDEGKINEFEGYVLKRAVEVYASIIKNPGSGTERVFFEREGVLFMRDWLEIELPKLLSNTYVPMRRESANKRRDNIITFLATKDEDEAKKELLKSWDRGSSFIQAYKNGTFAPGFENFYKKLKEDQRQKEMVDQDLLGSSSKGT